MFLRVLSILLAFLLLGQPILYSAYAAAITSNGTGGGAYGTGSTWVGGVVPTGSDTVTIAGTDTVTCTDARSVLATAINGTLTVDSGCTLTFDGNLTGTGTLRVNGGGTAQLEATTAARTINVNNIMVRGTPNNRGLIQSVNGSASTYGYFSASAAGKNTLDIQYGRFYRLGSSSNANTIRGASETVDHLEVDTSGRLDRPVAADLTGSISWNAVTVKNSAMSVAGSGRHFLAAGKSASYTNIVFDKDFWFDGSPTGTVTLSNIYTDGYMRLGASSTGGMTNLSAANIMAGTVPANYQFDCYCRGTIDGFYSYQPSGGSAKHAFEVYDYPGGTLIIKNGVMEFGGNTSASDMVVNGDNNANSAASTFNITGNIILKNGTGTTDRSSGSLVNLARGNQYETWNIYNNTLYMTPISLSAGSIAIVEGSTNSAIGANAAIGMIKNNLGWSEVGYEGQLVKVISSRRSTTPRYIDNGTVTSATATSLTDSTVSPNWTETSGASTLFANNPGAYVRITTAPRQQVVAITGQVSATELSVAAWTNGTPQAGDAYEIFMVDMITSSNTDYNGLWNAQSGTIYRPDTADTTVSTTGYNGYYITSGAPGAHDVTGDPGFTDTSRRLSSWDTSLGGPGTAANALAEIKKMNDDSGFNSNYTIAAALGFVRPGFTPSNAAYHAGYDGTWIGAIQGAASSSSCGRLMLLGVGPC